VGQSSAGIPADSNDGSVGFDAVLDEDVPVGIAAFTQKLHEPCVQVGALVWIFRR
jgi:hypothetical protein